jgi:uncharacterized protein (TIGR02284 family)
MENNQLVSDLKELIQIANDGKEGYQSAAEVTQNLQLKALFLKFAKERELYAEALKMHLLKHGAVSENETGGILGLLHRTWIDIKQAFSSTQDEAILAAIETAETVALEKYEKVMEDYVTHADHLSLIKEQRDGILNALKAVEVLHLEMEH